MTCAFISYIVAPPLACRAVFRSTSRLRPRSRPTIRGATHSSQWDSASQSPASVGRYAAPRRTGRKRVGHYVVSVAVSLREVVTDRIGDRVDAAAGADLGVDVDGVSLDGAHAHDERVGDLLIAPSAGDAAQDLDLPVTEAVRVLDGSGHTSLTAQLVPQTQRPLQRRLHLHLPKLARGEVEMLAGLRAFGGTAVGEQLAELQAR